MTAWWFVGRGADGSIASAHEEPQEDAAMERLAASDPEIVAFFQRAFPPKPVTVSRLRFKLELAARDLLASVEQAVQAAGAVPQLYWSEAIEFESGHPLVLQIGAGLGLSPADIRSMFESAAARDV